MFPWFDPIFSNLPIQNTLLSHDIPPLAAKSSTSIITTAILGFDSFTSQIHTGTAIMELLAYLFSCRWAWNIGGAFAVTLTANLTGVLTIFPSYGRRTPNRQGVGAIILVLAPPVNGGFGGFQIRIFIKPMRGWDFVGRGFWLPEGTERPSLSGNGSVHGGSSSSTGEELDKECQKI